MFYEDAPAFIKVDLQNRKSRCYTGVMARCIVSYVDTEGLRHTVEVDGESLYEAAVIALKLFKQHDCEPGALNMLEVEIQTSIKHTVTPKKIHSWLNGGARTPKEAANKKRLRELL